MKGEGWGSRRVWKERGPLTREGGGDGGRGGEVGGSSYEPGVELDMSYGGAN